jgi:hypothetical protein
MKSNQVKKFCQDVLNLEVFVHTIRSKTGWIGCQIKGLNDPATNSYIFKQSFPEDFRRICMKTVYPNSPIGNEKSGGNIGTYSITMIPHEWAQAISTYNGQRPQTP